jgi:hypothetical protein
MKNPQDRTIFTTSLSVIVDFSIFPKLFFSPRLSLQHPKGYRCSVTISASHKQHQQHGSRPRQGSPADQKIPG